MNEKLILKDRYILILIIIQKIYILYEQDACADLNFYINYKFNMFSMHVISIN